MDVPLPPPLTVPVSREELASRIGAALADNNVQGISAEDVRSRLYEIIYSFATIEEGAGIAEAPSDGQTYARRDAAWAALGTAALQNASAFQVADATLTALAGLSVTPGLVEETAADVFTKRALGVAAATSIPTRADGDARWQGVDATLTALAGLDAAAGLVEETAADVFTKRALGVAAATSIPTRADGDARWLLQTSYTAADVLAKLLTVDGPASGLNADLLDGLSAAAFAAAVHTHAIADVTSLQSGLDAKLDDAQLSTDATFAANSDTLIASQKATKAYVDTFASGLHYTTAVRVATLVNGALATAFANGQVVDGITLATGDRILIKNQTTPTENGIYTVNASGAPTRGTDADAGSELKGIACLVTAGTSNAGSQWQCSNAAAPVIGTDPIGFVQIASGAVAYTAGTGLSLTGNQFAVSDPELLALAGLASAADRLPYFTGAGTAALATLTSFARTLIDDTTQAAMQTTLGLVPGTNVQAADATLTALAGLDTTAGLLEQTAADVFTKRALGVGAATSVPTRADGDARWQGVDATLTALAGLDTTVGLLEQTGVDVFTKRALGVGAATSIPTRADGDARWQALDSELTALAGVTADVDRLPYFTSSSAATTTLLTSFGRSLLDDADNTAARATLGLGTAAVQNIGASGANVPLLNAANTWSAQQSIAVTAPNLGLSLTCTDDTATAGPMLFATRISASPANGDVLFTLQVQGKDSAAVTQNMGGLSWRWDNPTVGSRASSIRITNYAADTLQEEGLIGGGWTVGSPTGGRKGRGTLNAETLYQNGTALGTMATQNANAVAITGGTWLASGYAAANAVITLSSTGAADNFAPIRINRSGAIVANAAALIDFSPNSNPTTRSAQVGGVVRDTTTNVDLVFRTSQGGALPVERGYFRAGLVVGAPTGADKGVGSINAVALYEGGVSLATKYATLADPALTGNPTAPTPAAGDNDTSIATTAFVTAAVASNEIDLGDTALASHIDDAGYDCGPELRTLMQEAAFDGKRLTAKWLRGTLYVSTVNTHTSGQELEGHARWIFNSDLLFRGLDSVAGAVFQMDASPNFRWSFYARDLRIATGARPFSVSLASASALTLYSFDSVFTENFFADGSPFAGATYQDILSSLTGGDSAIAQNSCNHSLHINPFFQTFGDLGFYGTGDPPSTAGTADPPDTSHAGDANYLLRAGHTLINPQVRDCTAAIAFKRLMPMCQIIGGLIFRGSLGVQASGVTDIPGPAWAHTPQLVVTGLQGKKLVSRLLDVGPDVQANVSNCFVEDFGRVPYSGAITGSTFAGYRINGAKNGQWSNCRAGFREWDGDFTSAGQLSTGWYVDDYVNSENGLTYAAEDNEFSNCMAIGTQRAYREEVPSAAGRNRGNISHINPAGGSLRHIDIHGGSTTVVVNPKEAPYKEQTTDADWNVDIEGPAIQRITAALTTNRTLTFNKGATTGGNRVRIGKTYTVKHDGNTAFDVVLADDTPTTIMTLSPGQWADLRWNDAGTAFEILRTNNVPLETLVTYDPPSLADGAGVTTTLTVAGAVVGDFAQAAFGHDLQGVLLTAWVSIADTVSVRFQNETGGVVDLASGQLRARVVRK